MKTILFTLLLTFSLTALAKDKTADKPRESDIYTEVRDIMR